MQTSTSMTSDGGKHHFAWPVAVGGCTSPIVPTRGDRAHVVSSVRGALGGWGQQLRGQPAERRPFLCGAGRPATDGRRRGDSGTRGWMGTCSATSSSSSSMAACRARPARARCISSIRLVVPCRRCQRLGCISKHAPPATLLRLSTKRAAILVRAGQRQEEPTQQQPAVVSMSGSLTPSGRVTHRYAPRASRALQTSMRSVSNASNERCENLYGFGGTRSTRAANR